MLDNGSMSDLLGQQYSEFANLSQRLSLGGIDLSMLGSTSSQLAYQPQLDFPSLLQGSSSQGSNGTDPVQRGSASSDFLFANTPGNAKLYGLAGDDILVGNQGDDLLNGGTGRDLLIGGSGCNTLIDNDGGDLLIGGSGTNQFWLEGWNSPETPTTIADFQLGSDQIKVRRLGAAFEGLKFQDNDLGVTLSDRDRPIAVLLGIRAADLKPDNFIFGNVNLANQLQNALDTSLKESGAPGAVNAVVTADGSTWKGATGFSNLAQQTPMQPDDVFSIASTTKTFTNATILKLAESGKINLDRDTIGKWLPDVAANIPDGQNITLRQLLNGSSGIANFDENPQFLQDSGRLTGSLNNLSPEQLVSYVYGKPRYAPGPRSSSKWAYTNTGDIIAGLIVEKATGSPFSTLMREEILDPLGLKHTSFGGKEAISGNLARSYADIFNADGNPIADGVLDDITELNVAGISTYGAAGALFSNAQDVAQFTQSLFGGELLSADSVNQLTTFVDTGFDFPGFAQYGLGIFSAGTNTPPNRQWSLTGDSAGQYSRTSYFPDRSGKTSVSLVTGDPKAADLNLRASLDTLQTV
jgi:D-alanyl-D-alanine carboxypeptidase